MCARAKELGAVQLYVSGEVGVDEGFAVFADPAGHPFCVGWGNRTTTPSAAMSTSTHDRIPRPPPTMATGSPHDHTHPAF